MVILLELQEHLFMCEIVEQLNFHVERTKVILHLWLGRDLWFLALDHNFPKIRKTTILYTIAVNEEGCFSMSAESTVYLNMAVNACF